jgi:hypothetical protein
MGGFDSVTPDAAGGGADLSALPDVGGMPDLGGGNLLDQPAAMDTGGPADLLSGPGNNLDLNAPSPPPDLMILKRDDQAPDPGVVLYGSDGGQTQPAGDLPKNLLSDYGADPAPAPRSDLLEKAGGPPSRIQSSEAETAPPPIPAKMWAEADKLNAAQAAVPPQADWWQAENMADSLSGPSDYSGAADHYRAQAEHDPAATHAEIQAVADTMGRTDQAAATAFRQQMDKAGLMAKPAPHGAGYSESDLLGTWQSNLEQKLGQPVTLAADVKPAAAPIDSQVTRDAEMLKNQDNIPDYARQLADRAQTDRAGAEQQAQAVARQLYKTNPQAAEELARQGQQNGVTVKLYAEGYQAPRSGADIEAAAQANGGWLATGADKSINGGKECVALVKAEVPELRNVGTREWTRGEDIRGLGDPPLKPGTAIATGWDKNGNYPSNSTGNHAMIYLGQDSDHPGMAEVLDQYGPRYGRDGEILRQGKPATSSWIPQQKLLGYSTIRIK